MKRPKQIPEASWLKYLIGQETLVDLKRLADSVDSKQKHNPKGLIKYFDILGDFQDARVREQAFVLKMKVNLFGKDLLIESIYFAILFAKIKLDVDILKQFGIKGDPMKALTNEDLEKDLSKEQDKANKIIIELNKKIEKEKNDNLKKRS